MSNKNSPNNTPPRDSRSSSNASSSLAINTALNAPPSIAINPSSSSSNSTRTPPTVPPSVASKPNNSRYNPPVPSRMSGTYSSNNSIYKLGASNSSVHRLGTRSANNSPPGTPPNGLRDYYINAALQRSQHRLHPGSLPSSSSNLQQQQQRPSISILVPPQTSNILVPEPTLARRSYSADHLTINEPEITVTTPGGSNATEQHVMTLEAALNNLIEKEGRGGGLSGVAAADNDEDDSLESDEPIMMKGSIPESSKKKKTGSSTLNSKSNTNSNSGVSLTPKVIANRLDPEVAASGLGHGVVGSDFPMGGQDLTDKEKRLSEKEKEKKKKSHNRISKLFHREGTSTTAVPEVHYNMKYTRPPVQPSKAGVLSNLLKLQGKPTHDKH
ncbi:hypothetical protein BGX23_000095 [Mortierella sp. AD031]|nr:hypothetical protein BGX23_000095 [Mortierella sp. AD031]